MSPRFASGQDDTNMNVYYELGDLCTMWAFSGLQLNDPGALEKYEEQISMTTNLSVKFMDAAEKFIAAVLKADGWEMKEDESAR
jgi:hypothetical protein